MTSPLRDRAVSAGSSPDRFPERYPSPSSPSSSPSANTPRSRARPTSRSRSRPRSDSSSRPHSPPGVVSNGTTTTPNPNPDPDPDLRDGRESRDPGSDVVVTEIVVASSERSATTTATVTATTTTTTTNNHTTNTTATTTSDSMVRPRLYDLKPRRPSTAVMQGKAPGRCPSDNLSSFRRSLHGTKGRSDHAHARGGDPLEVPLVLGTGSGGRGGTLARPHTARPRPSTTTTTTTPYVEREDRGDRGERGEGGGFRKEDVPIPPFGSSTVRFELRGETTTTTTTTPPTTTTTTREMERAARKMREVTDRQVPRFMQPLDRRRSQQLRTTTTGVLLATGEQSHAQDQKQEQKQGQDRRLVRRASRSRGATLTQITNPTQVRLACGRRV